MLRSDDESTTSALRRVFAGQSVSSCEFESRSEQGIQHYVIKFVSDLREVGGIARNDR